MPQESSAEMLLEGGCRCGQVRYHARVLTQPRSVACACPDCQRASGTVVSVALGIPSERFTVIAGQDSLTSYADTGESGHKVHRFFCGRCGSPLFAKPDSYPSIVSLRAVSLDEPHLPQPAFAIFADRIPSWLRLADDIPIADT